ncbi:hypothetical protein LDC_1271 [sediment metagenome]|uniref:Uncharacterized protein n=1 Tax=sediment metagenome TaxID=749907 RepID=D9PIB5_9ZZZZ
MVAKKLREAAEELEDEMVDVRREDKTIREFEIPVQDGLSAELLHISKVGVVIDHELVEKQTEIGLRKDFHMLLSGPNGIGKSTLLEKIASGKYE